ncbi:hypothetical protein GEMRC1_009754 [Eukaryota sp. GEM-RC1]
MFLPMLAALTLLMHILFLEVVASATFTSPPQADGSTSVAEAFERSLSEAILPIVDANADLIFPLYRCKCPGRCESGYRGSLSQCSKWARDERHLFVNEQFKIHYFPSGGFSRGGCSVCGKTDPCKEFPL